MPGRCSYLKKQWITRWIRIDKVTRWWFQIFFIFTPTYLGKMISILTIICFQMGWFNHQPEKLKPWMPGRFSYFKKKQWITRWIRIDKVTRWWFQIFFIFTPTCLGKMISILTIICFQMGWFNHQPEKLKPWMPGRFSYFQKKTWITKGNDRNIYKCVFLPQKKWCFP